MTSASDSMYPRKGRGARRLPGISLEGGFQQERESRLKCLQKIEGKDALVLHCLQTAGDPEDRRRKVIWRQESRGPRDVQCAQPCTSRRLCGTYTELVYGKSRCVTYSSMIEPNASCPLGPALTAVIDPSLKPLIHSAE